MTPAPRPSLVPYIAFDRSGRVPFYKQIYEGFRSAILEGRLRPGQRLPSTRALAGELKISRLPVLNAFEQLLHEGYLEGRLGSGTFVKAAIPDEIAAPDLSAAASANAEVPRVADRLPPVPGALGHAAVRDRRRTDSDNLGLFRSGLPALDHFPRAEWARVVSRHVKKMSAVSMAYGDPAGYLPLREAIADYLRTARAVRCEADQVLIVSGSQMALQLCARALLMAGDAVAVEEPGYQGARDALAISGATILPVPVDDEGLDVGALTAHGRRPRAVYVTPSHQYPLGVSMTACRRLELLEWARRSRSWIIEDDYDSEYRFTSRPLGALQGMDTTSHVIYIGTFSKVLFPSLRVGYVVVPPSLVSSFVRLRASIDLFSPTLYQAALADFMEEGHFARHLRRMRVVYLNRRNALVDGIRERLDGLLTIHNADAGLHLVAWLPKRVNDVTVVSRASARGISATAVSTCYAGPTSRSGLVLGFGGANERQIARGVRTLEEVIRRSA
jgi:GntR family transcriptional regulator/MocR family aminotransferase